MEVTFASGKLQAVCESEKKLQREYGTDCSRKVMTRLSDLRAATSLAELRHLPGRCHELTAGRKGELAVDLAGGRRLVFEPAEGWPESDGEGRDPWALVDAVRIKEIVDYHDD